MSAAGRPVIEPDRYDTRLKAAARLTAGTDLGAILIGVGSDLRYLTGYPALALERLTMLVVPARGAAFLVAPRLEVSSARACPAVAGGLIEVVTWDETEDAVALLVERLSGCLGLPSSGAIGRVAISDRLWAMFVLRLQAALPGASFELASAITRQLRMVKDPDEITLLRLAAEAADRVIARVSQGPLIGRTEAEVSREIRDRLVDEGHELAEFAIVGSGPNSASPHHDASDRPNPGPRADRPRHRRRPRRLLLGHDPHDLGHGGDDGGRRAEPDPDFARFYEVLRSAQAAATAAVRPGIACQDLDATARRIIEAAGYGPQFFHRLGHGIGLEAHEDPYLVTGNREPLPAGSAFSIEPGIYFEGRFGARIEDIVVCGPDGPIVLNQSPTELQVVSG